MTQREHGIHKPAGIDYVPQSRFHHGRFGRLFRNLDPAEFEAPALAKLAAGMVDPRTPPPSSGGWRSQPVDESIGDNPSIPAGYTYFGQFVDHDLTFDPASSLQRSNDPNALHNFRTPRFDLDSVYGEGPDDEPFLYAQPAGDEGGDADAPPGGLLLGAHEGVQGRDLPRNSQGTALLGDPRNDENRIVSQLHVLFLRAHNKLVSGGLDIEKARRQLRWHYQYLVLNDFLPRIVGGAAVRRILGPDDAASGQGETASDDRPPLEAGKPAPRADTWTLEYYGYSQLPFMPVEFSVAAYRFGHSMIRPSYDLNGQTQDVPIFGERGQDLRGFSGHLRPEQVIDWEFFFELADQRPQASRLIDPRLAEGLMKLPFVPEGDPSSPASLAHRNLARGVALDLPSGEAVARRLGEEPLTAEELALAELGLSAEDAVPFEGKTPLWFYVLREAEVTASGHHLGPVGGTIVAETLLGLLKADPFAFVNIDPNWSPARENLIPHDGSFELADLVRFASAE